MDVDVETHAHHHKTGHSIIDLSVALSALVLSVVSVVIAIHHGHTMEKLVAANSWPSIELSESNADEQGHYDLRLRVANVGIGPARIEKFIVRYDGVAVGDARDLLQRCCGTAGLPPEQQPLLTTSAVLGRVLPARETIDFLHFRYDEASADTWHRLDAARSHLVMQVCYCSVFDECWIGDSSTAPPKRAESCDALAGRDYGDGDVPASRPAAP
ncbi:hypothetical protein [Solimonas terrae]|uniref:Uncharacterized protein n=1 Tax=Solimonas terrae TaxID=1396819 RepID=A0A6M2BQF7_9GAMM|nr:hypothetical protein [Solimonas terrae]NGY04303.1 hypothetical protein [Solimonas terrae]